MFYLGVLVRTENATRNLAESVSLSAQGFGGVLNHANLQKTSLLQRHIMFSQRSENVSISTEIRFFDRN